MTHKNFNKAIRRTFKSSFRILKLITRWYLSGVLIVLLFITFLATTSAQANLRVNNKKHPLSLRFLLQYYIVNSSAVPCAIFILKIRPVPIVSDASTSTKIIQINNIFLIPRRLLLQLLVS